MDWKIVKKIDAHVHLVPPETLEWIDGVWKQADPTVYLELMEEYHVEKALFVPINEGATYYRDCILKKRWEKICMKLWNKRHFIFNLQYSSLSI